MGKYETNEKNLNEKKKIKAEKIFYTNSCTNYIISLIK